MSYKLCNGHGQRLPCKRLICYLCNLLCRFGFFDRANREENKPIFVWTLKPTRQLTKKKC